MFKKFQFICGAAAVFITAGCTNSDEPISSVSGGEARMDCLMVSVFDTTTFCNPQEAIEIGAKIMANDGPRSCERRVETIVSVNDANGSPLFYVTNYADGQGFVILSAVKDYAPVLASSEVGRFDIDKCDETGTAIWFEAMKRAVAKADELADSVKLRNRLEWSSLLDKKRPLVLISTSRSNDEWERMVSDAICKWQNDGYEVYPLSDFFPWTNLTPNIPQNLLPPEYLIYQDSYVSGRQVIEDSYVLYKYDGHSKKIQLLSTKWGQTKPYNDYIPYHAKNPSRLVGCTAVAIGQITAYHRLISGYDYEFMFDQYLPNTDEISRLLYDIGKTIGIDYANGNTQASYTQVANALSKYGLSYQTNTSFDLNNIISSIYANCPVYAQGIDKKNSAAHAWVIDGFEENYSYTDWQVKLVPVYDDATMMPFWNYSNWDGDSWNYRYFCNWGYQGTFNGYFNAEGFNISDGENGGINHYNEVNKAITYIRK